MYLERDSGLEYRMRECNKVCCVGNNTSIITFPDRPDRSVGVDFLEFGRGQVQI